MPRSVADGSIRERAPGVWQVRVGGGYNPTTGKYRTLTRTVHGTLGKADKVRRALVREAQAGTAQKTDATVGWLLEQHLTDLDEKGRQASTVRTARIYAANLTRLLGTVKVAHLNAGQLDQAYTALLRQGKAPRTVKHHHSLMHAALQRALRWELVDRNVASAVVPPRVPHTEVVSPHPGDIQRLLAAAVERDLLLATLLFVAATTGARRGELCALRWSDLDLDAGTLTIQRAAKVHGPDPVGPTKTHSKRVLALDPGTLAALALWRVEQERIRQAAAVKAVRDPYLFSRSPRGDTRPAPDAITHSFVKLRRSLGLEHVQLKSLRHFAATQMLGAGIDLRATAARLGHSGGGAVTLQVYAHALPEVDQRAAAVLGALIAGPAATDAPVAR